MIYALHGVVSTIEAYQFVFRNLLDQEGLRTRLMRLRRRCGPLDDALRDPACDALAVDDATVAAANAALMIREHGHDVTLFVNPGNCFNSITYSFVELNIALDQYRVDHVAFEDQSFAVATYADRKRFRRYVKSLLRNCGSTAEQLHIVRRVASALGAVIESVPPFLRTLNVAELHGLAARGISIGNHGWEHIDPAADSSGNRLHNLHFGAGVLEAEFSRPISHFAAPFGETKPPALLPPHITWLLMSQGQPAGRVESQVFNRVELHVSE